MLTAGLIGPPPVPQLAPYWKRAHSINGESIRRSFRAVA